MSIWDFVQDLASVATPLVGLLIAWELFRLQRRDTITAKDNLKLAQFKERLVVFNALLELLRSYEGWYSNGRLVPAFAMQNVNAFRLVAVPAPFLFGKEENEYIESVVQRVTLMVSLCEEVDDLRELGEGINEMSQRRAREIMSWVRGSVPEAYRVFSNSMAISDVARAHLSRPTAKDPD